MFEVKECRSVKGRVRLPRPRLIRHGHKQSWSRSPGGNVHELRSLLSGADIQLVTSPRLQICCSLLQHNQGLTTEQSPTAQRVPKSFSFVTLEWHSGRSSSPPRLPHLQSCLNLSVTLYQRCLCEKGAAFLWQPGHISSNRSAKGSTLKSFDTADSSGVPCFTPRNVKRMFRGKKRRSSSLYCVDRRNFINVTH